MAIHKSRNPALDINIFKDYQKEPITEAPMTISGTINKTIYLLAIVLVSAYFSWNLLLDNFTFENFKITIILSSFWGFAFGFYIVLERKRAALLAPFYCIFQGVTLGAISVVSEQIFPGIIIQAISLTFSIFIVLLIIYKFKIIKADKNFLLIVNSLTFGVLLYYTAASIMRKSGVELPFLHENSIGGIVFSVSVVILAALNLVIDFDFIEQGVDTHIPKYMEWYCAFGLMVTILWLYLEILNLLMKLRKK